MSEKHNSPLTVALSNFLFLVGQRNEWTTFMGKDESDENMVRILDHEEIIFNPEAKIKVDANTTAKIYIDFCLVPHKKRSGVFLVYKFTINLLGVIGGNTGFRVVQGQSVLTHYAKRFAQLRDDVDTLSDELWVVKRPADLEAFFRAYDNLARLNNAVTLFNLP